MHGARSKIPLGQNGFEFSEKNSSIRKEVFVRDWQAQNATYVEPADKPVLGENINPVQLV